MFRFRIRILLGITIATALLFSYFSFYVRRSQIDYAAIAAIDTLGVQSGTNVEMSVEEESYLQKWFGIGTIEKIWISQNRDGGSISSRQLDQLSRICTLKELVLAAPVGEDSKTRHFQGSLEMIELYGLDFADAKTTLQSLSLFAKRPIKIAIRGSDFSPMQLAELRELSIVGSLVASDY